MAENASPPLSTSEASIKSKRHSLNIISPGPRPLQLASGSVLSSSSNSPSRLSALHTSGADSPPGPSSSSSVKNGRRQSSISYLPSNRDKDRPTNLLPSPLSPIGVFRGPPLRNCNSVAVGSASVEREMEPGSRAVGATSTVMLDTLNERTPATLVEKHAELLHFIAQKESKCLELRSQLATHEAELLQLKCKWERIINRGFGKTLSNNFPSPSTPSTASSFTGAAGSGGVVLEGIKEGVQGMGRFITAGLGSISQGNYPISPSTDTSPPTSREDRRLSSKFPVPLRLGSGSNYDRESRSSSSTSTSITTVSSSSTSATSLMLEHNATQLLSPPFTSTSDEASNDYDEFGDFEEAPAPTSFNEVTEQEESLEQVLMVYDTGATPTMSPNPNFKRRSRMDVEQNDLACEFDSGRDDVWTTSGTLKITQVETSSSSPVTRTVQPFPTKPPKIQTPSLPGVSSIPGLTLSSMPLNGTTPQSLSTWVGSVGKKWGEIRESQTFTKSQKRASVLLSDVSQSIVSALTSPSPVPASSRSIATSISTLENPFSTNASHVPSRSINVGPTITTNKNEIPISTSISLLDDLDIGQVDEELKFGVGSPLLLPDHASKLIPDAKSQTKVGLDVNTNNVSRALPSSDDEDWNW